MAELNKKNDIKTIAFYLPQFHTIPENDLAHGKGFTEWTNVKKAQPLFEGHEQPKIPLDKNYYNLLTPGIMEGQAKLAKEFDVFGFCYYHYWFKNGKKLLEKPIEMMLENKNIDIPFCLCWANENWSKRWDGGNNEIIVEQDYGDEREWKNHLDYLAVFFNDERYITINGNPILLIYKPELIPNYRKWAYYVKKHAKDYGFEDIHLIVQYPTYYLNGYNRNVFDYYIAFEPAFTRMEKELEEMSIFAKIKHRVGHNFKYKNALKRLLNKFKGQSMPKELELREYDLDWQRIIERKNTDKKLILGAFTDWDNTPRNKNGLAYVGTTPEKFGEYYSRLIKKIKEEERINCIFINAWNEWAEGAYLEPDENRKFGFLKALKEAQENGKVRD